MFCSFKVFNHKCGNRRKVIFFPISINSAEEQRDLQDHIQSFGESHSYSLDNEKCLEICKSQIVGTDLRIIGHCVDPRPPHLALSPQPQSSLLNRLRKMHGFQKWIKTNQYRITNTLRSQWQSEGNKTLLISINVKTWALMGIKIVKTMRSATPLVKYIWPQMILALFGHVITKVAFGKWCLFLAGMRYGPFL